MTRSNKAQHGSCLTLKMLFVFLLVCRVSSPAKAQEIVRGTFTLNEETRFGATFLPAGHYTVLVTPVTSMSAPGSRVSVFVRPEGKTGRVASVFARISQQGCAVTPNGLT